MKSIDEFATDYAQDKYLPVQTYNAVMTGANYVLDEIEKLIKDVSDEYPQFQQGAIIYGRLIKLLEQLKK